MLGSDLVRATAGRTGEDGGSSMFGTIVVGVDGSGGAGRAVETVAKIAAGTKDQVVVCHGTAVHHAWGKDLPAETTDETQQLVDRYVAQLAAAGVPAIGEVHQELDKGMGDALINVAKSYQAGLIVVGTRGRSNVKSAMLGSVAHEVVCKSALPVLVVPDKTG
jgi:nucleotide-binding universal stress UspA family protein